MRRAPAILAITLIGGVVLLSVLAPTWLEPEVASLEEIAPTALPVLESVRARFPESFPPEAPDDLELAASLLEEGRDVYVAEGCWHCHSQWVRPGEEKFGWGPPSRPSETRHALMLPGLTGNRRVGPDLARLAGRQSLDWHAAHLFRPSTVTPGSIMPAYPWLFEPETDLESFTLKPRREGLALLTYLEWLGRWPGEEGGESGTVAGPEPSSERAATERLMIGIYLGIIVALALAGLRMILRGDLAHRDRIEDPGESSTGSRRELSAD